MNRLKLQKKEKKKKRGEKRKREKESAELGWCLKSYVNKAH